MTWFNPSKSGSGTTTITPYKPAGTVQGTWAYAVNNTMVGCILFTNVATHADADECYFYVELSRGTYTLQSEVQLANNRGIIKIYLDTTLIATWDCYAAGAANALKETTGITVATSKLYKLSFKVDGKHASSSDYYAAFATPFFMRTA